MACCENCGDNTLTNAPTPDLRCPTCGMRVEDNGLTPVRWPDTRSAHAPAVAFPVDPATGAVILPPGMAQAPWRIPVPAPHVPPAAPAPNWLGQHWPKIAGGVALLAIVGGLGYWALKDDPAAPTPPTTPVANSGQGGTNGTNNVGGTQPQANNGQGGGTNSAGGTQPQANNGQGGGTNNTGGTQSQANSGQGGGTNTGSGTSANSGQGGTNGANSAGGYTPPTSCPAPACPSASHPRPFQIDLAATGTAAVQVAANGAPVDCELPPGGINPVVVGQAVCAWYCCTP